MEQTPAKKKKKLMITSGIVALIIILIPIMVLSPVWVLLIGWLHDAEDEAVTAPSMEERFNAVQSSIINIAETNGYHAIYTQDESGNDMFRIYMSNMNEPADSILVNVIVDDETDDTFSITYYNKTTWKDMNLKFMVSLANAVSEKSFSERDLRNFLKDNTQKYYSDGSKYKYKHMDFFEQYGYQYLSEETIRHNQAESSDYQDEAVVTPELTIFGLIKEASKI
jgi:hypothetical protein